MDTNNLMDTNNHRIGSIEDSGNTLPKFQSEFLLDRVSAHTVWNQIATSRGLSEWFAPQVDIVGKKITIYWDDKGDNRTGTIVEKETETLIKWVWDDDPQSYISMEIVVTELSNTTSLLIIDHDCSLDSDTLEELWENHFDRFKKKLGIY